jgi:hypothetical protein
VAVRVDTAVKFCVALTSRPHQGDSPNKSANQETKGACESDINS